MTQRVAIVQLARLLGKVEFYRRLPLAEGAEPPALDAERVAALRSLVDERLGILTEALAVEAVVSDDVIDASSAKVYLEDRLAFFGELLTEEQRQGVRHYPSLLAGSRSFRLTLYPLSAPRFDSRITRTLD